MLYIVIITLSLRIISYTEESNQVDGQNGASKHLHTNDVWTILFSSKPNDLKWETHVVVNFVNIFLTSFVEVRKNNWHVEICFTGDINGLN